MDYKMAARSHEFNRKKGSISSLINKSTINSFEAGYEYCQREYEEKLRWIPVEVDNPPIDESLSESDLHYSITVEVMNDIKIQSAYFNTDTGQWRSLITGCIINPTHWRLFYNAT